MCILLSLLRQMYSHPSPAEDNHEHFFQTSGMSLNGSVNNEGRMRRKLRYFFMNPCQKYRAKKRVPFKLFVQIMKIFVVTAQLILFAHDAERHSSFDYKNIVTFRHLYLKDWDPTLETMPYPPTRGPFAIYTYEELYDKVDFLLYRYNQTRELPLGSYDFIKHPAPPVEMCLTFYKIGVIYDGNQSFNFSNEVKRKCFDVHAPAVFAANGSLMSFDFKRFLHNKNITLDFDRLLTMEFLFNIKAVNLRSIDWDQIPDCYSFGVRIIFDNREHNGEVDIDLTSTMSQLSPCRGHLNKVNGYEIRIALSVFDAFVAFICGISLALCVRSLKNARAMRALTQAYFKAYHQHVLCQRDKRAFIDPWLILIIISDILVMAGSVMKLMNDNSFTTNYAVGTVLIGLGVGLAWFGILRYLSFFGRYNILLRVLSVAAPSLLRFCVCAAVLFAGFTLCGWAVIGQYHVKFKSIDSTAACLFSLLNGDDMYVTFRGIRQSRSLFFFYFNYVYLIVFISLFIYAVLNVFVTIIIDAYEVMKEGIEKSEPKTYMQSFMAAEASSDRPYMYRHDEEDEEGCNIGRACSNFCHKLVCCVSHKLEEDELPTIADEELLRREGLQPQSNMRRYPPNEEQEEEPQSRGASYADPGRRRMTQRSEVNETSPLLVNGTLRDSNTRPV